MAKTKCRANCPEIRRAVTKAGQTPLFWRAEFLRVELKAKRASTAALRKKYRARLGTIAQILTCYPPYCKGKGKGKISKTSKKNKKRPSPTASATLFKAGTVKVGNDGHKWKVKIARNGVRRWTKMA